MDTPPVVILSFGGVCTWRTTGVDACSAGRRRGAGAGGVAGSSSDVQCTVCRCDISDLCLDCATVSAHGADSPQARASPAPPPRGNSHSPAQRGVAAASHEDGGAPASAPFAPARCHISVGECSHAFHAHCLEGWLRAGHRACPLCQAPWVKASEIDRSALMLAPEGAVLAGDSL